MAQVKKTIRTVKRTHTSPFSIYWTKVNYYLLVLGVIFLIAGFYAMSLGSWDNPVALNLSPVLLVIGFLVILPLSILYKKKSGNNNAEENVSSKG